MTTNRHRFTLGCGFVLALFILLIVILFTQDAHSQQSLINIPSADVVEQGHVYTQSQSFYRPSPAFFSYSQNLAVGLGHRFEVDMAGYNFTRQSTATYGPGFKWAPYQKGDVTLFVGDLTSFPTNGNFFYAAGAVAEGKTRYTAGVWNSQSYFATGNRSGVMLGVEHSMGRFTPQCDWMTGSSEMVACALSVTINQYITIGPGYEAGNIGIGQGNHQALVQIGFMF